jgi:septal ring factor EnvC (AmiA/AmiB activator)
MNEIKRQVARVRRRMNFAEFLRMVSWSLTAALAVALLGVAIPRIWPLSVDPQAWTWTWISGGVVLGLIVGWLIAFLRRRDDLAAAIELDRRYGLKERVSSSLSLTEEERQTEFGMALLTDAERRVQRIDVREHFHVPLGWKTLLPLAPAMAMVALMLVPLAEQKVTASPEASPEVKQRIKKAAAELEKKLAQKKEEMKKEGLKEAEAALEELEKNTQKLKSSDAADRKDALVKLNEMAKEIQKRRNELNTADKLKKQLEDLKDLEKGPADKLAEAMQEGNMAQAAKEMAKLLDQMKKGELNKDDAEKLAKQLDQVQKKIEEMRAQHEQKKKELKEQIQQKKNAGDLAEAAKLQEELDQLKAQDKKMNGAMKQMADKMGQAAKQLQEGNQQGAAKEMEGLAQELQDLQDQLAEMDALEEAMNELDDAKQAMNCPECDGAGCEACQGKGQGKGKGKGKGKKPGDGLGAGQGFGERPEEKNDTKGYDSRVRAKADKGKSVRIGDANGPNIAGRAKQNVQEEVAASLAKEPDPIDEVSLPRDQREHSKEYFEKLLEGE